MKILIFLSVFGLFFLMSLFSSQTIFNVLISPLIKSSSVKNIVQFAVLVLGQSFWLLFLVLGGKIKIPRVCVLLMYLIFVLSLYLSLSFFVLRAINLFKPLNMSLATKIAFLTSALLVCWGYANTRCPRITTYNLRSRKNVKAKIAFISDLHIGDFAMTPGIMEKTFNLIRKENADFTIIGGDIVEGNLDIFREKGYDKVFQNSGLKIFAILGNHDYYFKNYMEGSAALKNWGKIDVLTDEYRELGDLILAGREDVTNRRRKSIGEIIAGVDRSKFLLLADHNPAFFSEAAVEGVDLQLSGHTHGGQFFPFNFVVKLFYEKPCGLLQKSNSILITSSGLSAWGPPIK
ncbi:MAG: metallophosphoesterase, partial [Rickettsiales bacterium]|nr:metallophosphoesterase [Rickettsiales bacterium]